MLTTPLRGVCRAPRLSPCLRALCAPQAVVSPSPQPGGESARPQPEGQSALSVADSPSDALDTCWLEGLAWTR